MRAFRNFAIPTTGFLFPAALLLAGCGDQESAALYPSFEIELSASAAEEIEALGLQVPLQGRAYVIFGVEGEAEPRRQTGLRGVPFWGWEVESWSGGETITLAPTAAEAIGYPLASLHDLPAGEYSAQVFLNVFTTFHRADGHVVNMHLNSGAGQSPWRAPGNAFSEPQQIRIDPAQGGTFRFVIDQVLPPIDPVPEGGTLQQGNPQDQGEFVKFVKIRSQVLSDFWGQDMYIGANILLPSDYLTSPDRHYPVVYLTGHFPGGRTPFGYSDESQEGRGRSAGFSEFWRSPESPKVILVSVRDANPYYDTGHSVNSANVGPYGDAFTQELIPYLETQFRMIPEGWARTLAGGSTGGWEALAIQIFNPDTFGGAWGWCPDPVDFHYYQIVNVYEDENAYWSGTEWVKVERPNARQPDGNVTSTILQENSYERAVGPNGRSGGQWAIWEALFSPVGPDGYAAPIWDRVTGEIDPEVAEYWRENWDLTHYLTENWAQVGRSLAGKLHIATGDMDSYYLNNAVELMEQALTDLSNPDPEATFEYGRKRRHCWIGSSPWRPGEDLSNAEFVQVVSDYLRRRGGTW